MITVKELQKLAALSANLTLFHGTDFASAADIQNNGLSAAAAQRFGGDGDFWVTNEVFEADIFAQVNPANGQPARLEFDVPASVILQLISTTPPRGQIYEQDGIQLFATSFALLNQHMANKRVNIVS